MISRSPGRSIERLRIPRRMGGAETDSSLDQQPNSLNEGSTWGLQSHEGNQNEERYVGKRELDRRYPVSAMTRWRWMKDPKVGFPPPVKLGPNGRNFWCGCRKSSNGNGVVRQ